MTKPFLFASFCAFFLACVAPAPPAPVKAHVVVVPSATASAQAEPAHDAEPVAYAKQLEGKAGNAEAIDKLVRFFDDALVQDKQDRNGPNVQSLRDQIVLPLTRACSSGDLEQQIQSRVIKLLFDMRDARGAPCFVRTLERYAPDKNLDSVRIALQAVTALKIPEAAEPVFKIFTQVRPSDSQQALIYREVFDAVDVLSQRSWENPCIAILGKPVLDLKNIDARKDVAFQHVTCSAVLGNVQSEKGIPSLIKIMLSPFEVESQSTAINALIKIGKPVLVPAISLLRGDDKPLVDYAKQETLRAEPLANPSKEALKAASNAYLLPAAVILGSIGRDESIAPMIDVANKSDAVGKVIIARELLKLPYSATTRDAVKRFYEKTPIDLTIPPGMNARGAIVEQMGYTFDAELVSWLVKDTLALKGEPDDLEETRGNAFVAALKLARFDQLGELEKLARLPDSSGSTIGKGYDKELRLTKSVLSECRDDLGCYLTKSRDPRSHVSENQFVGVKCAYMAGVLGNADTRDKLVHLLPDISGDAARFVTVQAIDHFSPKGDVAIADILQATLEEAEASTNARRAASVAYYRQFAYRLRARAQ